uniref:Uncharacterized protein n=1 Tax=Monodelphis domestica TaxID=13616 RepID=A0A5F8GR97_MONDO
LFMRGAGHPLTGDLHHAILGLDGQLLGGKVVHIEGHLPAVGRVLDLRYPSAQLAAEGPAIGLAGGGWGHQGGRGSGELLSQRAGQHPDVAGPAGVAGPLAPLFGQAGEPEGLVEEAAAHGVPVLEGVPAGASQEGEGDSSLGHVVAGLGWSWL